MSSDLGEPVGYHAGRNYNITTLSGVGGAGPFTSISNCANDRVLVQVATFSLTVIAAKLGVELRLRVVVSAAIALFTKGKLYRLTVQADAKTNCGWVVQTYELEVWIPHVGSWEVRSYKLCS